MGDEIKLIPVSQGKDNDTRAKFARNKAIDTPEKFIMLYNLKMLAKTNEVNKEFIELIINTYRNTRLSSNYIIIESEEETAIASISILLDQWLAVAILKRMAKTLLEEGFDSEALVYFKEDQPGWALVSLEGQDKFVKHWSSEKVAQQHDHIVDNIFLGQIMRKLNDDLSLVGFSLYDLSVMDLSFVLELKEMISDRAVEKQN